MKSDDKLQTLAERFIEGIRKRHERWRSYVSVDMAISGDPCEQGCYDCAFLREVDEIMKGQEDHQKVILVDELRAALPKWLVTGNDTVATATMSLESHTVKIDCEWDTTDVEVRFIVNNERLFTAFRSNIKDGIATGKDAIGKNLRDCVRNVTLHTAVLNALRDGTE